MLSEIKYRTSRSSGPGGQHVNKSESRVELIWQPRDTQCLDAKQKERLLHRMASRISASGELVLSSEKYRSQNRNKEDVKKRFLDLVEAAIRKKKSRIPTRPTASSIEKRINDKRLQGYKKKLRRKDPEE